MFKVKLILMLLALGVAGGGFLYVKNLQANLAISEANNAKLETGIEEQKKLMAQREQDFEAQKKMYAELQSKNIQIDQVIWHQGESDFVAKTNLDTYYQQVRLIMVELNMQLPEVPIYLAVSTYINTAKALMSKTPGVSLPLQKTQLRLINDLPFLHKGVVSDSIVDVNLNQLPKLNVLRFDGIHFSEIGQDILVNRWWSILWN
mgnify:CR=1 FL=1